jgi:hypothetical protein
MTVKREVSNIPQENAPVRNGSKEAVESDT